MNPEQWTLVEALFEEALDKPAEERGDWLFSACHDGRIREEVQTLLKATTLGDNFLEHPAALLASDLLANGGTAGIGRFGAYRIAREIGRGGMGVVYLAERADGQYEQRVAIKVLRRAIDTPALRHRFAVERQVLATLAHPNIAGLLDGGVTDEGQPYLVMRYVDGKPIDVYCREHGLSVEERLRLFRIVCDTVQHAHQHLVVHRDLKPTNIFVTGSGEVRLLDFGLAKLIEHDEGDIGQTVTGLRLLTPEYASPEQVNGQPITTASDVYQLGLLLYELLTGSRAYSFSSPSIQEIASVVCGADPPPPSSLMTAIRPRLARRQRTEIDAIVMTALRKEPDRRYASAALLSDDIDRYLSGRTVVAHRGSYSYAFAKFARRHWAAIGVASLLVALVTAYALSMTLEKRKTLLERDRAAAYAHLLTDLFSGANPYQTDEIGPETTLSTFLDLGIRRIRTEANLDSDLRSSLLRTMADAANSLGDNASANSIYRELLPIYERRFGTESGEYVHLLQRIAQSTTEDSIAIPLFRDQLRRARALEQGPGPRTAYGLVIYGDYLAVRQQFDSARVFLEEAYGMIDHVEPELKLGITYGLGRALHGLRNVAAADSMLAIANEIAVTNFGPRHARVAIVLTERAVLAETLGEYENALQWKLDAYDLLRESLGPDHPYTISQLNNIGVTYGSLGRHAESEAIYRRVLAHREHVYGLEDAGTVGTLQNLAASLLRQGHLDESEEMFLRTHDLFQRIDVVPAQRAYPSLSLTELYAKRGDYVRSQAMAVRARRILEDVLPGAHPLVAVAMSRQGQALMGLNRRAEARTLLLEAHSILSDVPGYGPYLSETEDALAMLDGNPRTQGSASND